MQAPVIELFLFPRSTKFGLKVLLELRILLKEGAGYIKIMFVLSRVCSVRM